MSRLDSFIRRMQAQRDCLNWAAAQIESRPGPALELGLGNGRTYDHLRTLLPGRDIFVFEREVRAHPDCIPPPDRLFLGDIEATMPQARHRLGAAAVLAHCDLGTGERAANEALGLKLAPLLDQLLAPGAIVIANQLLSAPRWRPLPEPAGVPARRYFLYQVGG